MSNHVEIKVKGVKPIHYSKRTAIEVVVGNEYYISFGMGLATPCIVMSISKNAVELKLKDKKKGYEHDATHSLFPDEIGATPEQAVLYTMTS